MAEGADLSLNIKATDDASPALEGVGKAASEAGDKLVSVGEKGGGVAGGFTEMGAGADKAAESVRGAGEAAKESEGFFSGLKDTLSEVGKMTAAFTLGNIAFDAAEQVKNLFESVTEVGEATHNLQLQTGATAEQASGLLAVFERWGVSNQDASVALGIFAKNLDTFNDNTAKADASSISFVGSINQLGLQMKDAQGNALPMVDVLNQVADKFQAMPDGVTKTADAMNLFGRSGKTMIEVLDQGSAGIQLAMDTAKQYGLVLSQDNVDAVYNFGQAQRDLSEALKGFAVQVGSLVLPLLKDFVDAVTHVAEAFNTTALPVLRSVAEYISSTFGPYIQAGIQIAGDAFNTLANIAGSALQGVLSVVESVGQAIYDALSWINPFATHSPSLVSQVSDGVASIQASYGGLTSIDGPLGDAGAAVQQFAADGKTALKDMVDSTKTQLDEVKSALSDAKNALSTWGQTPIQGTKAFQDQMDAIDTQVDQTKLKMDQIKLGNDVTPQLQALNAQLKQLQLNAPVSPLGGGKGAQQSFQEASRQHKEAIAGIQKEINAIKTGGAQGELQALSDQLTKLNTQKDALNLQEKLQLGPEQKQIADLLHPKQAEQPFQAIVKGIKDAQDRIHLLTPEQTRLNDLLQIEQKALTDATAATKNATAAHGALGAALTSTKGPLADVNANLDAAKAKVQAWGQSVSDAKTHIDTFVSGITGPLLKAFDQLKNSPLGGALGGLAGDVGGIGAGLGKALGDLVHGKGLATFATDIEGAFQTGFAKVGADMPKLISAIGDIGASVVSWLKGVWAKIDWGAVWASVKDIGAGIANAATTLGTDVLAFLTKTWKSIDWGTVWASATGFATGAAEWAKKLSMSDVAKNVRDGLVTALNGQDWNATGQTVVNQTKTSIKNSADNSSWATIGDSYATGVTKATAEAPWRGFFDQVGAAYNAFNAFLDSVVAVDYMPIGEALGHRTVQALAVFFGGPGQGETLMTFANWAKTWMDIPGKIALAIAKPALDIGAGFLKGVFDGITAGMPELIAKTEDAFLKFLQSLHVTLGVMTLSAEGLTIGSKVTSIGTPSSATTPGFTPPSSQLPQVQVTQHFYGQANPAQVGQASQDGVTSALRRSGVTL